MPVCIPASELRRIAAQYAAAPAVTAGEPGIAGARTFYIDISGLPAAGRGALLGATFAQATAMDPDLSVDRIQADSVPAECRYVELQAPTPAARAVADRLVASGGVSVTVGGVARTVPVVQRFMPPSGHALVELVGPVKSDLMKQGVGAALLRAAGSHAVVVAEYRVQVKVGSGAAFLSGFKLCLLVEEPDSTELRSMAPVLDVGGRLVRVYVNGKPPTGLQRLSVFERLSPWSAPGVPPASGSQPPPQPPGDPPLQPRPQQQEQQQQQQQQQQQ